MRLRRIQYGIDVHCDRKKKVFLCGIGAREGIVIRIGANVGNDGESGDGGEGVDGRNSGSLLL